MGFLSNLALNTVGGTAPYVVKPDELAGITNGLNANVAVIAPWGIGILAILLGIRFIPKVIKSFARG